MSKGDLRHRIRRGGSSNDSGFMYNSGGSSNNDKTKRKTASSVMRMADSQKGYANQILNEIPENRRQEIYEYMSLFGYKPDRTIVQVHITGFFKKKDYSQRQLEQHKAAVKKYGGTTFVVIGRTHDPLIMNIVTRPKQKNPYDRSPGYVGYLWKNKDRGSKAPHEILPLDFTPVHLPYPEDWKNKFSTKGFMIALHVPSSLAKNKNKLTRALYRIGKTRVDVKKEWKFLTDLKNINYVQDANDAKNKKEVDNIAGVPSTSDRITGGTRSLKNEGHDMSDPLQILRVRLAKGEITRNEYNELYDAISS
ncbi:MAG TPA: SHOCT domain-containing protein [Nitrososphaeraceae archaeon]|nr:SHOCT domain-containing protein [Nitrososphaeraceae archaeon]